MWKPHCFHVATTWFPHRHHVVSMHNTWLPCGYYVVPCAHHVVSRWTPFGFQVDTMWFPGGQHRVSKVDTMWFLQDTTGFPHGCHVMSIWTPCVVEVTTWKPAQKTALHEANWLPCYIWLNQSFGHPLQQRGGLIIPRYIQNINKWPEIYHDYYIYWGGILPHL